MASKSQAQSISKAKAFIKWAQTQAKKHGAKSEISPSSALGSPYSLSDYKTWGEVVADAKKQLVEAQKPPAPPSVTKIPRNSAYLAQELRAAQVAVGHDQSLIDTYTPGTKEYIDAQNALDADQKALDAKQAEFDKASKAEKAAKDTKDTTEAAAKAAADAAKAQKDLETAKARALAKDPKADPNADPAVQDAKKKADDAKVKSDTASGKVTGELRYGPNGESLVPGTAAYEKGSTVKPKVVVAQTPTPTSTKPTVKSGTSGSSGTGTSNKGGKVVPPPVVNKPVDVNAFLTKYGTTLAFINSDPSLKKLFDDATSSKEGANWDAKKFTAALANTDWAKRLSNSAQQEELTRLQNPSEYASSYNNMRAHIAQLAVQMGEALTPADIGPEIKPTGPNGTFTPEDVRRSEGTVTQWALDHSNDPSFSTGEALQTFIATKGTINLALPGGLAAKNNMDLKAYAGQMGLGSLALPPSSDPSAMGSDYFSAAAQSILLGKSTVETWKADLLQKAKDTYKAFAPSLDAGQTVKNIAAPYINTMANLLEIPTDQIDLSATTGYGKMVHDALIGNDPANQKPMALYDFEKLVKSRPEWGKTNNARDTIMGGVGDLLKAFGKVS